MVAVQAEPVVIRVFNVDDRHAHVVLVMPDRKPLIWDDTRYDYNDDLASENWFVKRIAEHMVALRNKLSGRHQSVTAGKPSQPAPPTDQEVANIVAHYAERFVGGTIEVHVFDDPVPMNPRYPEPYSDVPTSTSSGPGGFTYKHFRQPRP